MRLKVGLAVLIAALGLMVLVGLCLPRTPARMTAGLPASVTVAGAWNGVAPCLAPTEADYVAAGAGPPERGRIAGFDLRGTAPELSAFAALAEAADLQVVRGAGGCGDVNCAARLLFGEDYGPRLLRLAVEHHYLAFGPEGRVSRDWSVEDLDEVIAAFADLPPSLFPLSDEFRRIWHDHGRLGRMAASLGRGVDVVARAGHGVEGIVIGPGWHRAEAAERRASLVHEIAHELARVRGRSFNWRDAWRDQMAADAARIDAFSAGGVSPYAAVSLDEDFAESVTAYRYRAPALKRTAPHRYAFLKVWVFDGLEYGTAAACAAAPLSAQVDEAARTALLGGEALGGSQAQRQCAGRPTADACHLRAAYVQAFRSHWRDLGLEPGEAAESALAALLSNRRLLAAATARLLEETPSLPGSGHRMTAR